MPQNIFTIKFVAMGQGDCAIITCPDDSVIVVDCGYNKSNPAPNLPLGGLEWFYEAILRLRGAAKKKGIHALILTHPDEDHYNRAPTLLRRWTTKAIQSLDGLVDPWSYSNGSYECRYTAPKKGSDASQHPLMLLLDDVDVGKIYFSVSHYKTAPMIPYSVKSVGSELSQQYDALHEPFIRNGECCDSTWTYDYFTRRWTHKKGTPLKGGVLTVHHGRTEDDDTPWSVEIIAANVLPEKDEPNLNDHKNPGSIVTLLRIGELAVLLPGDASPDTENYLMDDAPTGVRDHLKKVQLLQMPHHGSEEGMYKRLKKICEPKVIVASCKFRDSGYRLPRSEVLDAWWPFLDTSSEARRIEFWEALDEPYKEGERWRTYDADWTKVPDKNGQEPQAIPKVLISDKSWKDAQIEKTVCVAFYRLLPKGKKGKPATTHYLQHKVTKRRVRLTSMGSVFYEIDQNEVYHVSYEEMRERVIQQHEALKTLSRDDESTIDEEMEDVLDDEEEMKDDDAGAPQSYVASAPPALDPARSPLHALIAAALQEDRLALHADALPEGPAAALLRDYVPGGTLRLRAAQVQRAEDDEIVLTGVGDAPPARDAAVTLTLRGQGAQLRLCVEATRATPAAAEADLSALAATWLGPLPLAELRWRLDSAKPQYGLVLHSAALELDRLADGLGSLTSIEAARLRGRVRLVEGELAALRLRARLKDRLELGPLAIEQIELGLGLQLAPDTTGGALLRLPTLSLYARLPLTLGAHETSIPIGAAFSSGASRVRLTANLTGPLAIGLTELAQLGSQSPLGDLLPNDLDLGKRIALQDFAVELALGTSPRVERLSMGLESQGRWCLLKLPRSGRELALTAMVLSLAIHDPFNRPAPRVTLHGTLDVDGVPLTAWVTSDPWTAQLALAHADGVASEKPIRVLELLGVFLEELGLTLPPQLLQIDLHEFSMQVTPATGAFELSLLAAATDGLVIAGEVVTLSTSVSLRYDPEATPAAAGSLTGTLHWIGLRFRVAVSLSETAAFAATLAEEVRLSALLDALFSAKLPPGVPDLATRDLRFSVDSQGHLSVGGAFEVAAQSFTLGEQPLALATLEFAFTQNDTQTTASITISGSTSDKLIPGLRCEGYALTFTYDAQRDDDTVWSLGGDVTLVLFDRLKLALGASYTASKAKSTLTLKLGAEAKGGSLLEVAPGGQRIASLDAASVKLDIITPAEGKVSWSFEAGSSLRLFAPGAEHPAFALTGGVARFERDADAGALSLSFSAEAVQLFAIDYVETIEEPGPGDEPVRRQLPRCFKAHLGVEALTLTKADGWRFDAAMALSFEDLPVLLRSVLTDSVHLRSQINAKGLRFETEGGLKPLIIPDLLKAVADEVKGLDLPELGDSAVKLTAARLYVGKELAIELEVGAALPQHLNRFLGLNPDKKLLRTWDPDDPDCFTTASLRVGTDGLSCQLERSPFLQIPGVEQVGGAVKIDFQEMFKDSEEAEERTFDLGAIEIQLPKVLLDVKKGALDISGGYSVDKARGVCMPLVPLKKLLALMQLGGLADALPKGIPIKTRPLTPQGIRELMADLKIPVSPPIAEALGAIGAAQDKLPGELVNYLSINVPESVDFALKVTPRGSFTISVSTEGKPLQVLIPSPAGLLGLRLSHLAGGNFIGNVLKFEISADIDFFDWPLLLGAATLLDIQELKPWLTPRERLRRGLELRALTVLIFFAQVGVVPVPVPVPIFYDRVEWWLAGVEGLEARGRLEFPEPEVDLVAIIKLLAALKESFAKNIDLPNVEVPVLLTGDNTRVEPAARRPNAFVFNAGPLYLSLPLWMGSPDDAPGQPITFGTRKRWEILDSLRLSQIVFNSGRHILMEGSTTYAVTALDISHRIGSSRLGLFQTLRFEVDWAFATPKEFSEGLNAGSWAQLGGEAAKDILALLPGKNQDSDEGLVTFLRGRFAIAEVLSVEAYGGTVLAGATLGTGLRFLGRIEPDLLRIDLRGLARIDVEEKTVLLHGSGELALLNQTIVSGSYTLHERGLSMRSELDLNAVGLPIALKGSLEGRFSDTELFLEGELGAKIGFLTAAGKDEGGAGAHALVHFSPEVRQLHVAAHLKLGEAGAVEFMAGIRDDGRALRAVARFSGHVLGLISVSLGGELQLSGAALTASGDGHLDLLGQRILEASFTLNEQELHFKGDLDLFKGLNTGPMPLAVTGALEGHIRHDQVDFFAGGEIVLGPFRCGASVELQATQRAGWLRITAEELFGAKIVLEIQAGQGTPDELVFHSHSSQALSLMHGALRVSAASDASAGPEAFMKVDKGGLRELRFDGAATLLGMRSAAVVRYEAPRLRFDIVQSVQWRPEPTGPLAFDAKFTLSGDFDKDRIFVSSTFLAMFDLGPVLSAILRALTGLSLPPPRLPLGFEVETLTLRVDTSPATRKQDDEARARRQALQAQLRELARSIREARGRAARGQEALEAGLARLAAAPNVANHPERRAQLERRQAALQQHQQALRSLDEHIRQRAEERDRFLEEKSQLEARELPEMDDWNLFDHHADSMWELSKVNKHSEFSSHRRALHDLIAPRVPGLVQDQPPGFNPIQLVNDMDWNMWWGFNGRAGTRPGHQAEAQRIVSALEKSFEARYRREAEVQRRKAGELQAEADAHSAAIDRLTAELNAALEAADVEIKAADGELVEWALADRLRADHAVYQAELGHEADIGGETMGLQSIGIGVRVHLHAKASFTLLDQPVALPEIRFTADLGELNEGEALLDKLPQLIGGYLEEHLVANLAAALSPLAILGLLRRALAGDGAGLMDAEVPLAEFLQVYGGLDSDDAALAADLLR